MKLPLGMKEYKLLAWPDLPAEFRRVGFRRMLSDLSQRHMGESMLLKRDGVKASEVRALLRLLGERGVLDVRQASKASKSSKWRPVLTGWLRRLTA